MATYTDDRNWDQQELDRARDVAKDNVVSEGGNVPQAAKIRSNDQLESQEPSPVLQGQRFTTEQERKEVQESTEAGEANVEAANKQSDADSTEARKSSKSSK